MNINRFLLKPSEKQTAAMGLTRENERLSFLTVIDRGSDREHYISALCKSIDLRRNRQNRTFTLSVLHFVDTFTLTFRSRNANYKLNRSILSRYYR